MGKRAIPESVEALSCSNAAVLEGIAALPAASCIVNSVSCYPGLHLAGFRGPDGGIAHG